ncbi:MAG: peptidoglycan-binding domain-containing protein [Alphaproteobacteria bacterium]
MTIAAKDIPYSWARNELTFSKTIKRGTRGARARLVQELLFLSGSRIAIDGDFGPATQKALSEFQEREEINTTGSANKKTFDKLTLPLRRALTPIDNAGDDLGAVAVAYAQQHLAEHPVEAGGDNMGPWVRLYMKGNDGPSWYWCAGFVFMILRQASDTLGVKMPLVPTFSCDVIALRGKEEQCFVPERKVGSGDAGEVKPGDIFLSRRTPWDWTHTGLVTSIGAETMETIEGNTNDEGSRNGYEVCARTRGLKNKDFVLVSP